MRIIGASLIVLALATIPALAGGDDHNRIVGGEDLNNTILVPDILAPNRFNPAPQHPSTVDQQRALEYRTQVQRQLKEQERNDSLGRLGPLGRRDLLDTRSEAQRMDRVTGAPPPGPTQFGSPLLPGLLPSLSH